VCARVGPVEKRGWAARLSQRVTDVIVAESHAVFRQGLVACLDGFDGIGWVESVEDVADAWSHPALGEADIVLLDATLQGAVEFAARVQEFTSTRVVGLACKQHVAEMTALLDAGAVATLMRENLTPERLGLSLRAVAAGATTVLATRRSREAAPAMVIGPELSSREQRVLELVADGLPTREIGEELHYSERTVKKVLGDVVVKLGARSRSQAIARAVRQGII
jgi:DNA-binding NarL/FixJ family response regulator